MAQRKASTIEVKPEAFTEYVRQIDEAMANTVWCHTPTAHTYYRSGGGRIVTAFPFRLIDVWQSHRAPNEEDLTLS
jgi:4-hydroxyacetophenone monooxygenase